MLKTKNTSVDYGFFNLIVTCIPYYSNEFYGIFTSQCNPRRYYEANKKGEIRLTKEGNNEYSWLEISRDTLENNFKLISA